MRRTWLPNEPSPWWFLPWMSDAIAPPIVTKRVPGVTGTNQPGGTITRSTSSIETPAPTVSVPAVGSSTSVVDGAVEPDDQSAAVLGGVAVATGRGHGRVPPLVERRAGAPAMSLAGDRRPRSATVGLVRPHPVKGPGVIDRPAVRDAVTTSRDATGAAARSVRPARFAVPERTG